MTSRPSRERWLVARSRPAPTRSLGLCLLAALLPSCADSADPSAPANVVRDSGTTPDGTSPAPSPTPPPGTPPAPPPAPPAPAPPGPPPSLDDVAPSVACPAGAEAAFAAAADAFAAALARDAIPGGALGMLCGGERIFVRTVGVAQPGGSAIDADTRFQIASTTKTLTGLTAATMAAEGLLSLDASIESLVTGVQARHLDGRPPTLEELLSHSAGVPPAVPGWSFETDSLEGLFALNARITLLSPPGAVWNYANYGFSLAGLALERTAGAPFGSLVERYAMAPAGMTRATMDSNRVLMEGNFAYGHSDDNGRTTPIGPLDWYYHQGHYAPTGGAWTSVTDLLALARHLIRRERIDSPGATSVSRPRIRTTYPGRSYGLGLFVDPDGNHPWWSHGGSVGGFLTSLDVIPDLGFAVVWMMNGDWPSQDDGDYYPVYALASQLTDYDPGPYEEPRPGDPMEWSGTYEDPVVLGAMTVRTRVGGAEIVWSDGSVSPIEVQWRDGGYAMVPGEEYPVSVYFWRDETGAIRYLVTDLGVGVRR